MCAGFFSGIVRRRRVEEEEEEDEDGGGRKEKVAKPHLPPTPAKCQ